MKKKKLVYWHQPYIHNEAVSTDLVKKLTEDTSYNA